MNSLNETVEYVNSIESKYSIENMLYKNVNIWPVLKRDLYFYLLRSKHAPKSYSKFKKTKDLLYGIARYNIHRITHRQGLSRKKYFFLTYSTFRRNTIEGRWFDNYVDSLIKRESIEDDSLCMEYMQRGIIKSPQYFPSYVINPLVFIRSKIKAYFSKASVFPVEIIDLINEFNVSGLSKSTISIHREVTEILFYSDYFTKILKRVDPEKIFLTAYTLNLSMGLLHAAQKLNIPTFEIQHGPIFPSNPLFCDWKYCPKDGYHFLPNYLLIWNEYIKKEINNSNNLNSNLFAINYGNSFNILHKNGAFHIDKHQLFELKQTLTSVPASRIILFCLARSDIPQWISEFIANDTDNIWLLRAHPGLQNIDELRNKNNIAAIINLPHVFYDEAYHYTLPLLLANVDIMVAYNSTTIMEAIDFNVRAISIDEISNIYFENEIKNNIAYVCLNIEQLQNQLITELPKVTLSQSASNNETWLDY